MWTLVTVQHYEPGMWTLVAPRHRQLVCSVPREPPWNILQYYDSPYGLMYASFQCTYVCVCMQSLGEILVMHACQRADVESAKALLRFMKKNRIKTNVLLSAHLLFALIKAG